MTEIFGAATGIGPFLTAVLVPFVGGVLVPLLGLRAGPRDPAAIRSLRRHAALHDALPEAAREPIRRLIQFEATRYARATMRKGTRKFRGTLALTLGFLACVLLGAELQLLALAVLWWPAYLIAGLLAGTGGVLISEGVQHVFKYEDGDPLEPAAPTDPQGVAALTTQRELNDVN